MSEDKPTIDYFELLLFDVSTNQWNVVDTKEDDNTPFSYFAYDKDGPDYRFKVVIVFSDGSRTSIDETPEKTYSDQNVGRMYDKVVMGHVEPKGTVRENGVDTGKYAIHYNPDPLNVRKDVNHYQLYVKNKNTQGYELKGFATANGEAINYLAYDADAPNWSFKVKIVFNDGSTTDIDQTSPSSLYSEAPTDNTGVPDTQEVICRTIGLTHSSVLVQKIPLSSVVVDLTGYENLKKRWQGEYSFTLTVKGYAWNEDTGGKSPNNEKIRNSDNWNLIYTSIKDSAGVMLISG